MKRYFELCVTQDGRYFFLVRKVSGELLARSSRQHVTRQSALDDMCELLALCGQAQVACYDRARRSWYGLRPDEADS